MMKPLPLTTPQQTQLSKIYCERVKSLIEDGYRLRHTANVGAIYVTRLHHMANGNDIIIIANYDKHELTQKTNHIVTHHETV